MSRPNKKTNPEQEKNARNNRQQHAQLSRSISLAHRQLTAEDADKDDVINPEDDLENCQRQKADPG